MALNLYTTRCCKDIWGSLKVWGNLKDILGSLNGICVASVDFYAALETC